MLKVHLSGKYYYASDIMPSFESYGDPMLLKTVITCIISNGSTRMLRIRIPGFLLKLCPQNTIGTSLLCLAITVGKAEILFTSWQSSCDDVYNVLWNAQTKSVIQVQNVIIIQLVMSSSPKQNGAGNLYFASNLLNRFPCLCHLNSTSMEQHKTEHLAHSCGPNLFSSCWFLFSYHVLTRMKYMDFSSWLTLCIM